MVTFNTLSSANDSYELDDMFGDSYVDPHAGSSGPSEAEQTVANSINAAKLKKRVKPLGQPAALPMETSLTRGQMTPSTTPLSQLPTAPTPIVKTPSPYRETSLTSGQMTPSTTPVDQLPTAPTPVADTGMNKITASNPTDAWRTKNAESMRVLDNTFFGGTGQDGTYQHDRNGRGYAKNVAGDIIAVASADNKQMMPTAGMRTQFKEVRPKGLKLGAARIPGDPADGDVYEANLRGGEAVLTKEAMDQPGMRAFVAAMNEAHPPRGLKKGAARDGYSAGTNYIGPDGIIYNKQPDPRALPPPAGAAGAAGAGASAAPAPQPIAVYQPPQQEKVIGSGSAVNYGKAPDVTWAPAQQTVGGSLKAALGNAWNATKNTAVNAFNHPAFTPVVETAKGTRDNLDGLEGDPALQTARAFESGGRAAAATAGALGGAKAGAIIGAPFAGVGAAPGAAIGTAIGGTLGYFAPEAVNSFTDSVSKLSGGEGTKLPSQIAAERRAAKEPKAFVGGKQASAEEQEQIANKLNAQANYADALAKFRATQEGAGPDKSRIYSQDFGDNQGVRKSTLANGQTMYSGDGNERMADGMTVNEREDARVARMIARNERNNLAQDQHMALLYGSPGAQSRVLHKRALDNELEKARIAAAPHMLQAEASLRAAAAKAKQDQDRFNIEDFDKLVKESGYKDDEAVAFTDFFRNQYAGRKGADGKIIPGAEGMTASERRAHMPQAKAMWEMVKQRNANLTKGSATNMAIEKTKEDAMTLDDLTRASTKLGQALGLKKLYGESPNEIGYMDYLGAKLEDAFLGNGADTMNRLIAPDGSTINVARASSLKRAAGPYELGDVKAHYKATQK